MRGQPLSFAPPAGENWGRDGLNYVGLPVIISETDGVTHVDLWTDPTVRPAGVVKFAENATDGLIAVVVYGLVKVKVAAGGLQAGAHRLVCCIGAGASDAIKAQVTALVAGNDYFALGDFLESVDAAAASMADIFVNPGQIAIA